MPNTIDHDIARVMRRQHGLIHRKQAFDLGASDRLIRRRLDGGHWTEVDERVYRVAGAPPTWHTRVMAACLSTDGVGSHRTGGVLWAVDGVRPGRPDITVARDAHRRRDVRLHETTRWDLVDRRVREGIPVTGVQRTVVDLARYLPAQDLMAVIDDVERRRLTALPTLLEVAEAHSCRGRKGLPLLRELLDRRMEEDAIPQSKFNRLVGEHLHQRGLPLPAFEHEIWHAGVLVGRVDLAFLDRMLAIELQSGAWHGTRTSRTEDAARRAEMTALGWVVLEFTWEHWTGRRSWIVDTVARHLELLGGRRPGT